MSSVEDLARQRREGGRSQPVGIFSCEKLGHGLPFVRRRLVGLFPPLLGLGFGCGGADSGFAPQIGGRLLDVELPLVTLVRNERLELEWNG